MPNKIVPSKIVYTTKDGGEIKLSIDHKIDLELTIHIDGGSVKTSVKNKQEDDDDKVDFAIPEFGSGGSLSFGKEVK